MSPEARQRIYANLEPLCPASKPASIGRSAARGGRAKAFRLPTGAFFDVALTSDMTTDKKIADRPTDRRMDGRCVWDSVTYEAPVDRVWKIKLFQSTISDPAEIKRAIIG